MDNINGISMLEANILLVVWDKGVVTNREVYKVLKEKLKEKNLKLVSYISIMLTMNNLARKNILKINKSKKTFIYSELLSRKELSKSIIRSVAEKLL